MRYWLSLFVSLAALGHARSADETNRFLNTPRLPAAEMPERAELQKALDRGVAFLLEDQNPNGSWGTRNVRKT